MSANTNTNGLYHHETTNSGAIIDGTQYYYGNNGGHYVRRSALTLSPWTIIDLEYMPEDLDITSIPDVDTCEACGCDIDECEC